MFACPRFFSSVAAFLTAVCLTLLCPCIVFAQNNDEPKRLKRSESFFGVHFDFHAGPQDQNIGAATTPEMVQAIIDELRPDFIQVDCKGHPGWSSYPTKVGNMAPGVTADSLRVWRDVTARNGVALYVHYSGVWDSAAVEKHPEWATVDANGNRSKEKTSVFGDYRTKLLVPQLLELALEYRVDGIWVDGECWATQIDYSDAAKDAYKKAIGFDSVPTAPGQDGWMEWCNFNREAFREYLRKYSAEVKSKAPDFQIASNWAFTDHMADPVSAPVDFISGDYSPNNSINAARYSARLMANQGIAWDLMAWSFSTLANQAGQKPGVQLSREAACVLSMGGAFQGYITQNRDGSVNLAKLAGMAETGRFCRERQKWCQKSTRVPQIALFCPTAEHYRNVSSSGSALFPVISSTQRAFLNRLLEMNYAVDILTDVALSEQIDEFPVAVFFGGCWSDSLRDKIGDYLNGGGSVVLVGSELKDEIPAVFEKAVRQENAPSGIETYRCGKGTLVLAPTPGGEENAKFHNAEGETFESTLAMAMDKAFPEPLVSLSKKQPLDLSVRKTAEGELAVHFVNASGPHAAAGIIESIDPVENIEFTLRLKDRPESVRLEPSGIDLDFEWNDGELKGVVPSVPIHEILLVR